MEAQQKAIQELVTEIHDLQSEKKELKAENEKLKENNKYLITEQSRTSKLINSLNAQLNDPNYIRMPKELSDDDWKKLVPPSSHISLYASPRFYEYLVQHFQHKQETTDNNSDTVLVHHRKDDIICEVRSETVISGEHKQEKGET